MPRAFGDECTFRQRHGEGFELVDFAPRRGRGRPPGIHTPRRPAAFRSADIRRAVTGVRRAGLEPGSVTVGVDGTITLHVSGPGGQDNEARNAEDKGENEWDELLPGKTPTTRRDGQGG